MKLFIVHSLADNEFGLGDEMYFVAANTKNQAIRLFRTSHYGEKVGRIDIWRCRRPVKHRRPQVLGRLLDLKMLKAA